jgi:hypothetical protein
LWALLDRIGREPITLPFAIPAYWTPEQALAVAELLVDLCEAIWAHYDVQLTDAYCEQRAWDSGPSSGESYRDNSFYAPP